METAQERYDAMTLEQKAYRAMLGAIERLSKAPDSEAPGQAKRYTLHRYALEVLRGIVLHAAGDEGALEAALPGRAPGSPWRPTHKIMIRISDPDTGPKIKRIKIIRQMLGLGLKESKDLVESAPTFVIDIDPEMDLRGWLSACQETGINFYDNFKVMYRRDLP